VKARRAAPEKNFVSVWHGICATAATATASKTGKLVNFVSVWHETIFEK